MSVELLSVRQAVRAIWSEPTSLCCKWHKSLFVLRYIQNTEIQCGQNVKLLNVKLLVLT